MGTLKIIGRAVLYICVMLCTIFVTVYIWHSTDLKRPPMGECSCQYWESPHQQHPAVLNRACKHDKDGFIDAAGVKVRVHKYRNICE